MFLLRALTFKYFMKYRTSTSVLSHYGEAKGFELELAIRFGSLSRSFLVCLHLILSFDEIVSWSVRIFCDVSVVVYLTKLLALLMRLENMFLLQNLVVEAESRRVLVVLADGILVVRVLIIWNSDFYAFVLLHIRTWYWAFLMVSWRNSRT